MSSFVDSMMHKNNRGLQIAEQFLLRISLEYFVFQPFISCLDFAYKWGCQMKQTRGGITSLQGASSLMPLYFLCESNPSSSLANDSINEMLPPT